MVSPKNPHCKPADFTSAAAVPVQQTASAAAAKTAVTVRASGHDYIKFDPVKKELTCDTYLEGKDGIYKFLAPDLETVTFFNCSIDDAFIAMLSEKCKNIIELTIQQSRKVTGATFDKLPVTLREINFAETHATDEALTKLATRCTGLQKVVLYGTDVSKAGLESLEKQLPNVLVISEEPEILD